MNNRGAPFEVTLGQDLIELVRTSRVPTREVMDISPDAPRALVCKGGDHPTVSLYDLMTDRLVWQLALSETPRKCHCIPGGTFVLEYVSVEDLASGQRHFTTKLQFLDPSGRVLREHSLPDRLSRAVTNGPGVLVGCEDGCLYAYDRVGVPLWRFRLPGRRRKLQDGRIFTPYPYHVHASDQWEGIAVASMNRIYLLDQHGSLCSALEKKPAPPNIITIPIDIEDEDGDRIPCLEVRIRGPNPGRPPYVTALAASPDGRKYVVGTEGEAADVVNHNLLTIWSCSYDRGEDLVCALFLDDCQTVALRTRPSLVFCREGEVIGQWPCDQRLFYPHETHRIGGRVVLHGSRLLSVVSSGAGRIAECEFSSLRMIRLTHSLLAAATRDGVHLLHLRI